MVRFGIALYPKAEGATFDHDYYRDKHVPRALQIWDCPLSYQSFTQVCPGAGRRGDHLID